MKFGFGRWKKLAKPMETVWVAYQAQDASQTAPRRNVAKLSTVDRQALRFSDLIFGALGLLFTGIAVVDRLQHAVPWRTPILVAVFFVILLGLAHLSMEWKNPAGIFLLHILVAQSVCSLNLFYVQGSLAPFWQPYLLACTLGVLTVVLATQKAGWGLALTLSYLIQFSVTTLLISSIEWQPLLIRAGLIATSGVLMSQVMSLLGLSMTRVHERTVKLRLSKEELEEVNRIKTDFFNNVSHEFRTPITLTLGPIQGILGGRYGAVSDSTRQELTMMASQQQRLLQLINQILDAAKLEAGLAELRAVRVIDFNAYISSRTEQFRPLSEQKNLELKVNPDPRVVGKEFYIDHEKFDKILFNLLSNAHKFTKEGSIEISTQWKEILVTVTVKDSGMGIREDQIEKIFDRFKQAEGSSSADVAGTGLGLSLVKAYSVLHGGDVTVRSVFGEGTSFEITLPAGKLHLKEHQIVPDAEMTGEMTQGQTFALATAAVDPVAGDEAAFEIDSDKPRVLYVDDHAELRKYVGGLLKEHYNVAVAVDGQDGLAKAKQFKPDLILSDLMMPVMNGVEFCQKVREDTELMSIPFVLLTAKAELDSKISGLEKGADDYLAKPFSEPELMARVKNLVALRQQQVRLKRELQAARAIQQALLPKPVSEAEVVADYLYYPSEELSGDFCDIILHDDWLYTYVADVTSHGTAAAQVTYLLKGNIHESIRQKPNSSMQELIATIAEKYKAYGLEYDVAIQFGRFNRKTRLFEYVRGSSPSPLRLNTKNEAQALTVQPGSALSSREAVTAYPVLQMNLEAGDRVFLFTDGCYEFTKSRREFSLKNLYPLFASLHAEGWQKETLEQLIAINHSPLFPDDVTVLRLNIL